MRRLGLANLLLASAISLTATVCQAETGESGEVASLPASEFQRHVEFLASDELAGRPPGSEGSAQAAAYIIKHLQEAGFSPLLPDGEWLQEFPLNEADPSTGSLFGKNILAVRRGRGALEREAILVSAHYDHLASKSRGAEGEDLIYNGADDNASGVAVLLMLARALAEEPELLGDSCRTVIFASFDAEEKGLLGAKFYVQHPPWPLDRTAAVINFDAVGRLRMDQFFAFDAETSPQLAQFVRDAAAERRLLAETRLGGHGRSDHAVFLAQGIPGVHFCTGVSVDYHQVTDQWQRLNLEGGAKLAGVALQVVRQSLTDPQKLEFRALNPTFDVNLLLNVMRSLGIVPNVNAQEGRYPQILFVVPDSPAARHGLASSDQITSFNGMRFNRVEEVLAILQQLTFEEGLRLTVLREGGERPIELPAEVFAGLIGPQARLLENGKYEVRFSFQAETQTKKVYLAGEFNDWQPTAHRMNGPDKNGLFTTQLTLEPGVYQYKFVLEGTEWASDPRNMYRTGEHNNSVLWVGRLDK
jgi:hypothetical protein